MCQFSGASQAGSKLAVAESAKPRPSRNRRGLADSAPGSPDYRKTQWQCADLESIPDLLQQIGAAGKEVEAIQDQRALALAMLVEKRLIEIVELMLSTIKRMRGEPSNPAPLVTADERPGVMLVGVVKVGGPLPCSG